MRMRAILTALGGILTGMAPVQDAHAGGFLLQEQSQREIGRAFSGGAASADDPSTIFYNPAGMTELEGLQFSTGATALFISTSQENLGSTRSGPGSTPPQVIAGGNGGNPFAPVVPVPTTYVSWQAGDSGLWLGFGLSAPFGLKLRYNSDFFGRYDSLYSNLLTLNAQPSVAYKLSDAVSVGAGLDIQYADVSLTGALPPLDPSGADANSHTTGDDISLGWNAGILVKLAGGTRLGLHYRSGITHEIRGHSAISGFTNGLSVLNGKSDVLGPLKLPDSLMGSISAPLGRDTRLMLTGRFYNWSVFKRIAFIFPSGVISSRELTYKDSWSISAGIDHRLDDRVTLRAGSMFDKTPTNEQFLSTRVPDGDRTWASAGFSYRLNDHFTLNASYAHVFIDSKTMIRAENFYSGPSLVTVTTRARSSGNVDMIAASITTHF